MKFPKKGCVFKMGRNLWKKMYNKIQLNTEQKSKIWFNIESETTRTNFKKGHILKTSLINKRKYKLAPVFIVCCLCIILVAGIPAIASGSEILDRIVYTFNLINEKKQPLTEEQKDIYEDHINALETEIILKNDYQIFQFFYQISIENFKYYKQIETSDCTTLFIK